MVRRVLVTGKRRRRDGLSFPQKQASKCGFFFLFLGTPFGIVKCVADSLEGGACLKPMASPMETAWSILEFCKVSFFQNLI